MSNHFEHLSHLVEKKTVYYGQLIDLMNEEWRRIGENDLEKLEELLQRKHDLLLTIEQLNQEREQVVQGIAVAHSLAPEGLTLKEIIGLPGNTHKSRLQHFRRTLRSQIDTINKMSQTNRKLIRQSSRTVKESIDYLVEPGPQYTPYDTRGDLPDAPLEGRMVRTSA